MTDSEMRVAAHLLEMAGDEFGNRGANDFDLARVMPDKAERDALVLAYHTWNGDPEEYREQQGAKDYRLMDFMLMDFMAARLRGE